MAEQDTPIQEETKPQAKAVVTETYFFPEQGISVEASSLEQAQKLMEKKTNV